MGRGASGGGTAAALIDPAIEQIHRTRPRLDDLLESRVRAGTTDVRWVDAHDAARQALDDAEERLRTAVVCTSDTEELRRMMTSLAQRAGRHPATVNAALLEDFAARVQRLELN